MSSFGHVCWLQVLLQFLLLQLHFAEVQAADPMSLKLRRLNEQFNQFKASTKARLDMLDQNHQKNSSWELENQVQALNKQYQQMSHDLEQLNRNTAQDIDGLRDWNRKLEKKNKRMDARLALMVRNLREKCRQAQKPMPDPALDSPDLTLELQSQEERVAALQVQRDELLLGLKGLQESLKSQAERVSLLEGQLNEVLQGNGKSSVSASGTAGGPGSYQSTPQEYHELHKRVQTNRGGKLKRVLNPQTRPRPESPSKVRTGPYLQMHPHHAVNQPEAKQSDPKTKPDHVHPQSQIHYQDQTKPYPTQHKLESSVSRNFLQIPVRHKIPTQPVPKMVAAICNVGSMLLFPPASAENYVTFSRSLPDLPELSVCLWLRVDATHVGTLLSYATNDNDNQLVLYGRSSSPSLDFVMGDPVYRRLDVVPLLDAHWHHLCVLWSSIQGRFWHYNDHRLTSSGSSFRKGWEIPGGGSVVLGQEQDTVGGGFDPAEGFSGQIAGFRVWNRVLSASEVEGVANGRGVPRGVILGMEDIREVHGEVQQVACECLEHCV